MRNYQTRLEAQQDVLSYITMFYNCYRLHSYLGYVSPKSLLSIDSESEESRLTRLQGNAVLGQVA
jgi:transposase InsO family protein